MPNWNDDLVLERNVNTKNKDKTQRPRMYNIIFYNDDYTHFEFVMKVLYEVFDKSPREAIMITTAIHCSKPGEGGIVGTYTEETANHKAQLLEEYKKEYDQPLLFDIKEAK